MQLGMRQARYFGRTKSRFQPILAAIVANLMLVASKLGMIGKDGNRDHSPQCAFLAAITHVVAHAIPAIVRLMSFKLPAVVYR